MSGRLTSFQSVYESLEWKAISNCPGRFVLGGRGQHLLPNELIGTAVEAQEYTSLKAADPVLIIVFAEGGIISYRKADGLFVHTLNTAEGLQRRLADLEIALEGQSLRSPTPSQPPPSRGRG